MKNIKSYLELKIVSNNLQELERLIIWSEYLGFIHDGYSQEENGLYWTFLKIDNDFLNIESIVIEEINKTELFISLKKKDFVKLYDFAYSFVKDNKKNLKELRKLDLLFN